MTANQNSLALGEAALDHCSGRNESCGRVCRQRIKSRQRRGRRVHHARGTLRRGGVAWAGEQKSRLLYLHATAVVAADPDANWASLMMTRIGTAWWSVALLMFATMQATAEPRRV